MYYKKKESDGIWIMVQVDQFSEMLLRCKISLKSGRCQTSCSILKLIPMQPFRNILTVKFNYSDEYWRFFKEFLHF